MGTDRQATAARFASLMDRLQAHPVLVPTPAGGSVPITYAEAVSFVLGALYQERAWQGLAAILQQLDRGGGPLLLAFVLPPPTVYDNTAEARAAIACADADGPRDPRAWPPAARMANEQGPYFGSLWTYLSLPCATWPSSTHQDRYVGPFDRVMSNPILVVGNRFDPATPYAGAQALTGELGNARLLTLDGWGHTATFQPSTCAHDAMDRYLVDLTLPPVGTVCKPDGGPFDAPPTATAGVVPQTVLPGLPPLPGWLPMG
ncbi:MAG: alpha/beta hydrolase [Candidatus Dormibacteria bacterium]